MKQIIPSLLLGFALFLTAVPAQQPETPPPATPAAAPERADPAQAPDFMAKVSYLIGRSIGMNLHKDKVEAVPDSLLAGLKDALAERPSAITDTEAQEIMTAFQQLINQRIQDEMKKTAEANRAQGEAFLATNKAKPDVVTLPSGLQYRVLTDGTGVVPKSTDTVKAHYRGTLLGGKEFDSSYGRGEPATFPVTGLIPGVSEALQLMKVGSKWEVFLPASLAYGDQPAGPDIGPGSTLIFTLELIAIQPPEPAADQAAPPPAPEAPPAPSK